MPQPPAHPKIYHIVHVDRLASIVADGCLWSDTVMVGREGTGTTIGMNTIKVRRRSLNIPSHPGIHVGGCVPFYFCPRSVMLYILHRANAPDLSYRGGQQNIIHLEADLHAAVAWANKQQKKWAFTLSNAGAEKFESRSDLKQLKEINWTAVNALKWSGTGVCSLMNDKQAEFLVEDSFAWSLVEQIGVHSRAIAQRVEEALKGQTHQPSVSVKPDWYY
ncbi:DUF4433 domain-containing protein [Rhodoplanes sp. SY1]|uniref:type II toxin-antitoxin system toxin DNA ADP-ribosyl transferase DarT n=1 Tax=Rhodoplanes sp. SY1 TaxID=3166646 RepID=UPI0038B6509B